MPEIIEETENRRGHVFVEHMDGCEDGCTICGGGLALWGVCKGGEGALTTECPGYRLTEDRIDEVYAGVIDFRDGSWSWGKSNRDYLQRNSGGSGSILRDETLVCLICGGLVQIRALAKIYLMVIGAGLLGFSLGVLTIVAKNAGS